MCWGDYSRYIYIYIYIIFASSKIIMSKVMLSALNYKYNFTKLRSEINFMLKREIMSSFTKKKLLMI
jgi:hypothetical protein